jgi:hypothetical protein
MTNGANYTRGKLHHSPWHSDIRTPNQLNTPPEQLSRPIQSKNSTQRRRGGNQSLRISTKHTWPINLLSDGIPDAISTSDTISETIPETISYSNPETISKAFPNTISEATPKFNSDDSHHGTLLQDNRFRQQVCEAVSKHLSSQYIAQVDLSISSHVCSKIVLRRNVCNCSSAVDSNLDACNQSQ